jgi:YggT family protein
MMIAPSVVDILDQVIRLAFTVWYYLMFAWIIVSWIPNIPRYHPVVQGLERIIEPTLRPFRQILPGIGPIDISPILAFMAYQVIESLLLRLLHTF